MKQRKCPRLGNVAPRSRQAREIPRRHAMGDGSGFCWKPRLSRKVCLFKRSLLIFHLLLQSLHCLGEGLHLLAQCFDIRCCSGRRI